MSNYFDLLFVLSSYIESLGAVSYSPSIVTISGIARNLIWGGVYVLTSHCNFKTRVNVPHVNKTVTGFGGIYTDIAPVATPLVTMALSD